MDERQMKGQPSTKDQAKYNDLARELSTVINESELDKHQIIGVLEILKIDIYEYHK